MVVLRTNNDIFEKGNGDAQECVRVREAAKMVIAYVGSMLMTGPPTEERFFYGVWLSPNNQEGKSDNGYCGPSRHANVGLDMHIFSMGEPWRCRKPVQTICCNTCGWQLIHVNSKLEQHEHGFSL